MNSLIIPTIYNLHSSIFNIYKILSNRCRIANRQMQVYVQRKFHPRG